MSTTFYPSTTTRPAPPTGQRGTVSEAQTALRHAPTSGPTCYIAFGDVHDAKVETLCVGEAR